MGYRNLRECINDLERTGQLLRIETEVDAHLEAAEIQRRVYAAGGPALFFANVKDCRFPMVSNLFGTRERTWFLFRDAIEAVKNLIQLKLDPSDFWKDPWRFRNVLRPLWSMRPRKKSRGPLIANETTIDQLPQLQSWPDDGGAFITLPLVYSEHAGRSGLMASNLGMYRVQISGGEYEPNKQVGLHYQIHRTIGVHHAAAIERGVPFRVNIFVGGSPAMNLAAVMPLPENISELTFAGALGRNRIPMIHLPNQLPPNQLPLYGEADFCISGIVDPEKTLPEGPFGDHLGYYSLVHDFPVLNVERVYHRDDAIWPFTVVGRPPQEDTSFGAIIHELTGPAIPAVIPGVHEVHAVDAAGVHPLLLAIGSERYVPYAETRKPQELLTAANAILGQGQLSLAKYLFIVAKEDNPELDGHDIPAMFRHLLERINSTTDIHFQTQTTIDTLDYSGSGFNAGSKVVFAAAGPPRRELANEIPVDFWLPDGFGAPRIAMPGVIAVQAPLFARHDAEWEPAAKRFCDEMHERFGLSNVLNSAPLIVLVDDSEFAARTLNNFLWVTFTRSNPASDIYGIGATNYRKHWGCSGPIVIDARIKPHHAPPLVEDPAVTKQVDKLFASTGPLAGIET